MHIAPLSRAALLAGTSFVMLAAVSAPSHSQSVDYGSLEQLYGEPVTTSATGKPQKASEVPANMEIITQDDIRRSGADNIPDILQFITGMDVRRYGFAMANVAVRGMNQPWNPRLLVLVNGRQVYSDDYGYVPWQSIPVQLDEIRQIEIVKGPNSALFGFNAVSGVINIITYDPLYDNVNTVTARAGTQRLAEGSVVTTVHGFDGDAGLRASAGGYLAQEYWSSFPRSVRPVSNPKLGALSAEGKWRAAPGIIWDLSASTSSDSETGQNSSSLLGNFASRTNSFRSVLNADTKYGSIGFDIYRNETMFQSASTVQSYAWRNDVWVGKLTDTLQINAEHAVRFGLEYRNNSMTPSPGNNVVLGPLGYQVYSGSAMWDWKITPKLSLTNAVRFDYLQMFRDGPRQPTGYVDADYNAISHKQVSYNSGLVYLLTEQDTFRLTAARGIEVPSLFLLGANTTGNPNIKPSIVSNYEFDYDRSLPMIDSVLRTALFYQTYDDVMTRLGAPSVRVPNGTLAALSNNVGDASQLGVEIGIRGHSASGFRWNASYSFESVNENLAPSKAAGTTFPLLFQKGTPRHVIIAGAGYTWNRLELDGQLRWQSNYTDYVYGPTNPAVLVSDFVTLSARVGYRVTDGLTVAVSGDQLAKDRLLESGGPPVARRVIASMTARF